MALKKGFAGRSVEWPIRDGSSQLVISRSGDNTFADNNENPSHEDKSMMG